MTRAPATLEVARFVAGCRYDELPSAVREQAKLAIIDAIGALLAGLSMPSVERVRDLAVTEGRAGKASVLGTDLRLAASAAALANGAAAHALDYDNISLTVSGFVVAEPVVHDGDA